MPRSLRCPRCSTVVTVADGQAPLCPSCGFGGPVAAIPTPPAQASPTPQPPAAEPLVDFASAPAGFSSPPPMGQPSGWAQPQGRTDGMSVAALVMGCLGWLSIPGLVLSILAIVFGIQGMNRCKRTPGLRGHGMALAGLVLGCFFLAVWALLILFVGALFGAAFRGGF